MVDFDARDDAFAGEVFGVILAVVGDLASGFVKKNDAIDVVLEMWCGEEDIAVVAAIIIGVGDV